LSTFCRNFNYFEYRERFSTISTKNGKNIFDPTKNLTLNMTRSYETIQQSKFYFVLYTVRTSIYFKDVAKKGARPPNRNVVSEF